MLEHYFGIIEAIFIFSLAIAFYVWQMRDLRKAKREAEARECGDCANKPTRLHGQPPILLDFF